MDPLLLILIVLLAVLLLGGGGYARRRGRAGVGRPLVLGLLAVAVLVASGVVSVSVNR